MLAVTSAAKHLPKRYSSCSKHTAACSSSVSPARGPNANEWQTGWRSAITECAKCAWTTTVVLASAHLLYSVALMAWLFIKMTWRKVSSGEMSSGSWVVLLITCFIVAMVYTAKEISNKIQRFRALPDKMEHGFQEFRAHLANECGRLKSNVAKLKSKVDDLDSRTGKLQSKVVDLHSGIGKLESAVGDLGSHMEDLDSEISSLGTKVTDFSNEIKTLSSGQQQEGQGRRVQG